jgi:hypothetical protein
LAAADGGHPCPVSNILWLVAKTLHVVLVANVEVALLAEVVVLTRETMEAPSHYRLHRTAVAKVATAAFPQVAALAVPQRVLDRVEDVHALLDGVEIRPHL